jgi:hypothetical protein
MPDEAKAYATSPTFIRTGTNGSQRAPLSEATIIDDTNACARVLVESSTDMSFIAAPNRSQVITTDHLSSPTIKSQLKTQLDKIKTSKANSLEELWMYFDSGASRSVISPNSPIRSQLQAVTPAYGSCSIGDGTPLQYIEKGNVRDNLEITVVKDLKYDLFSSVNAAKQGLTSLSLISTCTPVKTIHILSTRQQELSHPLSKGEKGSWNYPFI